MFTVCCTVPAEVGKGGGLAEDDVILKHSLPTKFPNFFTGLMTHFEEE